MKNIFIIILIFSLNAFFEEKDDFWQITDYEDADRIWLTVNGQITHGDKYRISLSPKDEFCNLAVSYMTVYTTVDDGSSKFKVLPSEYVEAEISNIPFYTKIISTDEFLAGNIAWFWNSSNNLNDLKQFFKGRDSFTIELKNFVKDGKLIDKDIEEYFDVLKNSWSLDNFEKALDEAYQECTKLMKSS